ncbi:MAG: carbohydrate ABC transporter permease [Spirochaetaceae bacterium]
MNKLLKPLLYTFLIIVALFQIYPLVYLFFFSLKDNGEIFGGNVAGLPQNWLWSNYSNVFNNSDMPIFYFNSALITTISIAAVIVLGGTAAYAIQRMKWKYSGLILTIFLLGIMIPTQSSLLPLFTNLSALKMTNSYQALILPYVAFGLPIAIYIFTGFYHSIPYEMEESGCLEGCNIFQIYFHLILPLVKPAIATIAIFTYRNVWNELLFAVTFITNKAYKTVPVGLMSLRGRYSTKWGPIGAALLIAVLPSLIIYFVLSRQVQESLASGAVKG